MFKPGDRIKHKQFGGGTVVSCPTPPAQNYYIKWDRPRVNREPQDHSHVKHTTISLIRSTT